MSCQVKS